MFIFKAEKALEILTPILTVMERRTSNRIISELWFCVCKPKIKNVAELCFVELQKNVNS